MLRWVELAESLAPSVSVVVIGSGRDDARLRAGFPAGVQIHCGEPPDWVCQLLLGSECVVGNDSGIAHLCGLLEVPCIAVHAGTLPHEFLFDMAPSVRSVVGDGVKQRSDHSPGLLASITPASVYEELCKICDTIKPQGTNQMTQLLERPTARKLPEILKHVLPHTLLDEGRLAIIYGMSRHASLLDGDMAEVGVYTGGTSALLSIANPTKTIHAFDTFTGIPNASGDDVHLNGDFDLSGNVPLILDRPNISVHVGMFPATADPSARYCFAHFDGDTYESCIAFIEYFTPRMNAGGVMVFDDFTWHKCPGVERALREKFKDEQIIQTRPTQAMVLS